LKVSLDLNYKKLLLNDYDNRIKRIQYGDGYYEGETDNNMRNGKGK